MRLNGKGKWIEPDSRAVKSFILEFKDFFTAEKIFKELTPKPWKDEI